MRNPWRLWLVVGALALGAFAVACGDDNNNSSDGGDATATDEATTEATSDDGSSADATDTPEDGSNATDDSGSSGSADVPLPDGANEESSFTYSGSQLPFAVPSESGVDASTFGEVTVKSYTVDGTPEDIVNFYKDNQGDWDEAYALTTSDGGLLLWTMQDGQQAAWIVTTAGSDEGTTSLTVATGHAD